MLNMTPRLKRLLCRLLIGILLFTQIAIAAYACPQLSPTRFSQPSAAVESMAMPSVADIPLCCDGMGRTDPDNPNICAGHCQFGQQSDQTQTPTMPAALLASLYIVSPVPELTVPTRPAAASAGILVAASPPHAILHCCFRN